MTHFSGLTFNRCARDQNVGKPNKFKYNVSTNIERVQNSTAKTQLRSTLPERVGTLTTGFPWTCNFFVITPWFLVKMAEPYTTVMQVGSGMHRKTRLTHHFLRKMPVPSQEYCSWFFSIFPPFDTVQFFSAFPVFVDFSFRLHLEVMTFIL